MSDPFRIVNRLNVTAPTVRQARWWWRVVNAAPSMSGLDVFSVAGAFVERELRSEVLGEKFDVRDLEACLAFGPWEGWPENTENAEQYDAALAAGVISGLRRDSYDLTIDLVRQTSDPESPEQEILDEATATWWGRRDSNPHALRHMILNHARLPFRHFPVVMAR